MCEGVCVCVRVCVCEGVCVYVYSDNADYTYTITIVGISLRYQDGYRLVTVHNHGDLIVLSHWKTTLSAP